MPSKLTSGYRILRTDGLGKLARAAGDELITSVFERCNRYEAIYRLGLIYSGYSSSPKIPSYTPDSAVLQTSSEYKDAISEIKRCGLVPHNDSPKNWDHLSTLVTILEQTDSSASILDAGGETYSPLVHWLYLYGYRDLTVINISFDEQFWQGPISYQPVDITNTAFPDGSFNVITCLSVIEHGVNIDDFLCEANRLLQDGGQLILSTDYWPEGIDSSGISAYGLSWNPFDKNEINKLIESAEKTGFRVSKNLDLAASNRTVTWRGKEYTFIMLEFEKEAYSTETYT